ncbi:hypothetical protein FQN54_007473 [Arachnomyces sp. PD_36]|nr:hypothetical protein FQN54_007473 [Arachnomyces sp. PD_36]
MDPISVAASAASLAVSCTRILQFVYSQVDETRNIDEKLLNLSTEVGSLFSVLMPLSYEISRLEALDGSGSLLKKHINGFLVKYGTSPLYGPVGDQATLDNRRITYECDVFGLSPRQSVRSKLWEAKGIDKFNLLLLRAMSVHPPKKLWLMRDSISLRDSLSHQVRAGDHEGIRILLRAGASIPVDIIQIAMEKVDSRVLAWMLRRRGDPNSGKPPPLLKAVQRGYAYQVDLLLNHGASIKKATGPNGLPVLMHAVEGGNVSIVRSILAHGASPADGDSDRVTALARGAALNHPEIVQLLLDNGARTELKSLSGQTALAVVGGERVAEILLDQGANIEVKCNFGKTPLVSTVESDKRDVIRVVFDRGANTEASANSRDKALKRSGDEWSFGSRGPSSPTWSGDRCQGAGRPYSTDVRSQKWAHVNGIFAA